MSSSSGNTSNNNNRGSITDWEQILAAKFVYFSWDIFEEEDGFVFRHELAESKAKKYLKPFGRKKKVVFVSCRFEDNPWMYIKGQLHRLSQQFDGFFLYRYCVFREPFESDEQRRVVQLQRACMHSFAFTKLCYVLVTESFDMYRDRFWMMWEVLLAAKNRRLIVNENVKPLIALSGTSPSFETMMKLFRDTKTKYPHDKERLLAEMQIHFLDTAHYSLIPTTQLFVHDTWQSIRAVPVTPSQAYPARVLMISHRWDTDTDPDPDNRKLKVIRNWLADKEGKYDYVFFDWICVDQQKDITQTLATVDELYAKSHCLCLCEKDYFHRSWCLFEMAVNKFNIDSQTLLDQQDHPIVDWLEDARLVQQMGYIHTLEAAHQVVGKTRLELPMDQLHLKTQLRSLLMTSSLTNQGDIRVILNLLDKLVQNPD